MTHPLTNLTRPATSHRYAWMSAFLLVCVSGCDIIETLAPCSDGHCQAPVEAIDEMRVLGATITSSVRPWPESVDTDGRIRESDGEDFVFSNELNLYFSPAAEFDTVAELEALEYVWSDHPYAVTFSQEIDGVYQPIKPLQIPGSTLLEDTEFGPVAVTPAHPELILTGNHVLEIVSMFPRRATHVELWYRSEREHAYTLLRRVPLDSLYAWQTYLAP